MLHWLIDVNLERIEDSPLSFLRLLLFPEFQALLATLLCFLSVLGLGGPTIRWLVRMRIGDTRNRSTAGRVFTAASASGSAPGT